MAASTAPREAQRKDGLLQEYLVQAGVTINKGTLVSVDATGYARPARSGTATDIFVGVAYETVSNTGAAGSVTCRVYKTGSYVFATSVATAQTNVGAAFYAADDETLTTTATSNQLVGYAIKVEDASDLRIRIDNAVH